MILVRNIMLNARKSEIAGYDGRYNGAMKAAFDAVAELITLSDTPSSKATTQNIENTLKKFLFINGQAKDLDLRDEREAATKVLLIDAT